MMSDDARSMYTKQRARRRILVVSNADGSPSESSSDDDAPEEPQPRSFPRPLPSPRSQPPYYVDVHYGPNESHSPPRLKTTGIRYPPSNPTLSSPSSTSSPAVESTPPPSTPGLGNPPQIPDEGTIRQDMINPVAWDRPDTTPSASRPGKLAERSRTHGPLNNPRRDSWTGSRPATVRCDSSFIPP